MGWNERIDNINRLKLSLLQLCFKLSLQKLNDVICIFSINTIWLMLFIEP